MDGEARRKKLGTTAILPCGGKRDGGGGGREGRRRRLVEKDGRKRDRGGTRRKLGLHGGLEYLPTPTDWLHHRHRLHLLCPTSYLPILDAYPAPSGWRHAQDASGIKLLGASLFFTLLLLLLHLLLLLPLLLLLLFGKLPHLHHASLSLSPRLSVFVSILLSPSWSIAFFFFFTLLFTTLLFRT